MKKIYLMLLFFIGFVVYSFEVDKNILLINQNDKIKFENYIGPYLFYNTVEEIRGIGSYLASNIIINSKSNANYSEKYILYHNPRLEWEETQISSDVLEITGLSLIDNIDNIELIISQYLIDLYNYNIEDADLLAHLIVIYNATYRSDLNHIINNYSVETFVPENKDYIGLDLHYYNWAGQTFIYIPLSQNILPGNLSNINSDILLSSDVIETIKLEDSDNIEFREEIVDFKEREFDQVTEDIENSNEDLEELRKEFTENEEKIIDGSLDDSTIIKEEQKNLEKEIELIEDTINDKKNDLKKKEELIVDLRDELAEDKNNLILDQKSIDTSNSFFFMINNIIDEKLFGQLALLNTTGDILLISDVNSIRNNTFNIKGDFGYIIAGGDKENQIVTLGMLDIKSFDIIKWSNTLCYENSPLIIQGNLIYVQIILENKIYIGEFDSDLNLVKRSPSPIMKDSFTVLKNNIFYIQGKDNNIELFDLSDFVKVSKD